MVVIARFPRLDEPVGAEWPEVPVVPGDAPVIAPVPSVVDGPRQPGPVGFRERARNSRVPFPVVSTLVLAVDAAHRRAHGTSDAPAERFDLAALLGDLC